MKKPTRYKAPPPKASERRVYLLPPELVLRVHAYGQERGHASEAAAVRELLETALREHSSMQGDTNV